MTVVYKVIYHYPLSNKLVSAWANGGWEITYVPKKWINAIRGQSKLFVFDTLEAAENYRATIDNGQIEIWKAEAEGAFDAPTTHMAHPLDWHLYWQEDAEYRTDSVGFPTGTKLCTRVKLLERIDA